MGKRVAVGIQIDEDLYARLERIRDAEHRSSMSNTILSIIERAMSRYDAIERGDTQIDVQALRRRESWNA